MFARVTKVLPWILPIIQTGECGWPGIKDEMVRQAKTAAARAKKIKKAKRGRRKNNGYG